MTFINTPLLKAAAVCAPLYFVFGKVIFGSWGDFLEALRFWCQPDWLSILRGEFTDDFFATLKMAFFLCLCAGSTYLAFTKFFAPIHG